MRGVAINGICSKPQTCRPSEAEQHSKRRQHWSESTRQRRLCRSIFHLRMVIGKKVLSKVVALCGRIQHARSWWSDVSPQAQASQRFFSAAASPVSCWQPQHPLSAGLFTPSTRWLDSFESALGLQSWKRTLRGLDFQPAVMCGPCCILPISASLSVIFACSSPMLRPTHWPQLLHRDVLYRRCCFHCSPFHAQPGLRRLELVNSRAAVATDDHFRRSCIVVLWNCACWAAHAQRRPPLMHESETRFSKRASSSDSARAASDGAIIVQWHW